MEGLVMYLNELLDYLIPASGIVALVIAIGCTVCLRRDSSGSLDSTSRNRAFLVLIVVSSLWFVLIAVSFLTRDQ